MKSKKLWGLIVLLTVIVVAIFYFKDSRNMDVVEKKQLQSAADSAEKKLDLLNEDFENLEFNETEIEEAMLAYDTIK